MALGEGSKKSFSCDQGVTNASLRNEVSNANTEIHLHSEIYCPARLDYCITNLWRCYCKLTFDRILCRPFLKMWANGGACFG